MRWVSAAEIGASPYCTLTAFRSIAPFAVWGSASTLTSADPAPTTLMAGARHDRLIEAFGGVGYHVRTPDQLDAALIEALASGGPALIDCMIAPADGTESGHLTHLNPAGVGHPAQSASN
ncbi:MULTISPECIES: thiamine pyrophosphate-dependent enzyme [unclassified Mycolicibacterium]|uniref:thiamine pyrophosphate-dependent enzyme n=1 Tax=unclassified Mycolicibacterium TaxID=2636767 RepID=UPI0035CA9DCF